MSSLFELQATGLRYNGAKVLDVDSLEFQPGELVAIVGPNGAGKSTLLGILAGLREQYTGRCLYRRREVRDWPRRMLARSVSFVPQSLRLEFPFTVEQVVMMGRTPYGGGLLDSREDRRAAAEAMEQTDTLQFRHREFYALSGGERQRVVLAAALAQEPEVLLLDEPTSFLDVKHQVAIQRILRDLCASGLLAISATHDLNQAVSYSSRVVVLDRGRVVADGGPRAALRPEVVHSVFEVRAEFVEAPDGRPWIRYER